MIASSIYANDDLRKYPEAVRRAVEYVMSHDFMVMEPGVYPIDGDRIYAKVFDLTSKEVKDTKPEVHKKYIDVQFWVSGEEMMGFAPKKADYPVVEANEEQDLYFLGDVKDDSTPIQELLVKQVQSSVYMEDTLHRLGELGVDHILEVGPGSALAGFVKKTLPGVVCASVETPEQLNAALTAWKEEL